VTYLRALSQAFLEGPAYCYSLTQTRLRAIIGSLRFRRPKSTSGWPAVARSGQRRLSRIRRQAQQGKSAHLCQITRSPGHTAQAMSARLPEQLRKTTIGESPTGDRRNSSRLAGAQPSAASVIAPARRVASLFNAGWAVLACWKSAPDPGFGAGTAAGWRSRRTQ
jgi:hypothetical protein